MRSVSPYSSRHHRIDILREVMVRKWVGMSSLSIVFLLWHFAFLLFVTLLSFLWWPGHYEILSESQEMGLSRPEGK